MGYLLMLLIFLNLSFAIDLRTAIEKAINYSPYLASLEEEAKGVKARELAYKSLLNPSVSVELGNFGTSTLSASKSPIYRLSYSQPILLYSIGELNRAKSQHELMAFGERIKQEKNRLIGEVYASFYNAVYKKELLNIARQDYEISKDLHTFIKKLYDLGEITKLELLRAERDLEMARRELELAKNEYERALKELSFYLGEEVKDVEGSLKDLRDIKDLDFDSLPQVRFYDLSVKALQEGIRLEKAFAKPQPSVEVLGEKVGDHTYGFRLSISSSLPLFYRRETEILQLASQINSYGKLKELELARTRTEYEGIRRTYQTLLEEIKRIEEEDVPKAKQELELALKSYKLRTITQLELSDSKRRYLQLLRYRADLLMRTHQEFARYLAIGGKL